VVLGGGLYRRTTRRCQRGGSRVTFVNGVFDLFHYVLGGIGLATVRIQFDGFGTDDDTGGSGRGAVGSASLAGSVAHTCSTIRPVTPRS